MKQIIEFQTMCIFILQCIQFPWKRVIFLNIMLSVCELLHCEVWTGNFYIKPADFHCIVLNGRIHSLQHTLSSRGKWISFQISWKQCGERTHDPLLVIRHAAYSDMSWFIAVNILPSTLIIMFNKQLSYFYEVSYCIHTTVCIFILQCMQFPWKLVTFLNIMLWLCELLHCEVQTGNFYIKPADFHCIVLNGRICLLWRTFSRSNIKPDYRNAIGLLKLR